MFMRKILLLITLLLLTAATDAWAQFTVELKSGYTSVPTIYAGVKNYMALKVTNTYSTDASNVPVTVSLDGYNIYEGTIESIPAGETFTLIVCDETIRPIDANTVNGSSNQNAVYTVSVNGTEQGPFSFVILYNGYLSKDYAYIKANPLLREFTFTGDVLVLTQAEETYLKGAATDRKDVFSVDLDEGKSVEKALLYVSYYWDKVADGDFNNWTTTFNGQSISPLNSYRDQSNLGAYYSGYGYGLVVYDVTNEVVNGDNTFALEKPNGNAAVYPSSLIVMVNKPSGNPKAVYILEEADLLSNSYNIGNMDVIYNSSFSDVAIGNAANLYVFAANAQNGEGNLTINGDEHSNVWNGTSSTFDTYQASVAPGDVSVKFKATGSTILALHQMLIVDLVKGNEGKTGEYWATYYNGTKSCQADANTTVYTGALNGDKIDLTEVTDKKIPAGNAVILKSNSASIPLTPITATGTFAGNGLLGTDADLVNPGNAYCLSKNGTTVGFYKFTSGGTIPAHRAYIVGSSATRSFYGFGDDDTTGIDDAPANLVDKKDSILYDLTGRMVTGQPRKGIYVRNGKKIIIK